MPVCVFPEETSEPVVVATGDTVVSGVGVDVEHEASRQDSPIRVIIDFIEKIRY
jgi:precorrin-6B methylase 1